MVSHGRKNGCFDLSGRDSWYCPGALLTAAQKSRADIKGVTDAVLHGIAWAHPIAAIIVEEAGEERADPLAPTCPARAVGLQQCLHGVECLRGNDGLVFA